MIVLKQIFLSISHQILAHKVFKLPHWEQKINLDFDNLLKKII